MSAVRYPRVASLKTPEAFRAHLVRERLGLSFDDELAPAGASPLGRPFELDGVRIGNRWSILPMEGWDGTPDGEPSDLTRRRWQHFGQSGAKFIWGGEAVAVRHDGRANPNQLLLTPRTQPSLAALRDGLVAAHRTRFGSNADGDLFVGLQLTHSGRWSRPDSYDRPQPLAASPHPVLDRRFSGPVPVADDHALGRLVDDFVNAARLAWESGFAFVDVKQCHGYLGHELLGAKNRSGRYGGSLAGRTRFVTEVVEGIRASVPGLRIGVRLSAFDTVPYTKGAGDVGVPQSGSEAIGFCVVDGEVEKALGESIDLIRALRALGVRWMCITGGSPYYSPHIQRPALFPPVDGYEPPEDPLRGVARQIEATACLKREFPDVAFVGSGYSYLQEWLPHVAQHAVRQGMTDFVGLGRMVLAYPDLPADVLCARPLRRASLCRTFSDCTTAPRMGLVSGCYPLDPEYAARAEAIDIRNLRAKVKS